MRKLLVAGALAVFTLFLPSESRAVPLDFAYQTLVDSFSTTGTLVISTANFSNANSSVNDNVGTAQWCINHLAVSSVGLVTFTMFWSTNTLTTGTTDFMVNVGSGTAYDVTWPYHTPYCSPTGKSILTLKSNVAISTISVEGFLYKGWNP